MRILMVNSNRYKLPVPAMPFGVCYVSSVLEDAGYEVRVLDLCFSEDPTLDINDALDKFRPDIIGISIRNIDTAAEYNTFFQLDRVKNEVVMPIKKVFSGTIVIGGAAVGIAGAEMLSYFDLEYAIRGDGEIAMVEFVRRIENKLPLNGLGGLVWRKNGKIVEENSPMTVTDLNTIPEPRHDYFLNLKKYLKLRAPLQIQTKRGCELKCTYCTYNTIEGHEYRLRDPRRVADEIEAVVKKTGVKHFEFSDSTFNLPLEHAKAVLRAIIAKKMDLNLQIMGLNPGAVDEELIDLMKQSNFKEIQVGIESCSDPILKNMGKNFRKNDILRAGKILRESGIPIMWYLMTGAPGETEETLTETFETIIRVASKWDLIVVMNGIRAYKGSPISERMLKEIPGCTKDNFLRPIFYSPSDMDIKAIRIFNKRVAFRHPNILFPEDVQRVPLFAVKISCAIMRLVAPQKPWWKFNVFLNKLQKILGIYALKRIRFERKYRKKLKN